MRLLVGLILNLWMGQLEQKIGELPFLLIGIPRNLLNQLLSFSDSLNWMELGREYFYSVIFEISDKQMQFTGSKIQYS